IQIAAVDVISSSARIDTWLHF
ncbi:unnamed protein product, partial [Rotaria magnacalcarata]